MLLYDSEKVCKPAGQKIKSKHTWHFKNDILEKSNQMTDLAFQKTKHRVLLSVAVTEDKLSKKSDWKQNKTSVLSTCYTESEKKKEGHQQNVFSLPYEILGVLIIGFTCLNSDYCSV